MPPEISCQNCQSHCCSNVELNLTPDEHDYLEANGTVLIDITPPNALELLKFKEKLIAEGLNPDGVYLLDFGDNMKTGFFSYGEGERLYLIVKDCGLLSKKIEAGGWRKCKAFGGGRRPRICGDTGFPAGSPSCLIARQKRGINP